MITFNKEQMDKLVKLEKIFNQAYYHAYKHSTTSRDNDMVNDILNEVTGVKEKRNMSCGICVLKMYQKAGEIYFRTKEMFSAELEPKDVTNSEPIIKNKRGRKKVANNVTEES